MSNYYEGDEHMGSGSWPVKPDPRDAEIERLNAALVEAERLLITSENRVLKRAEAAEAENERLREQVSRLSSPSRVPCSMCEDNIDRAEAAEAENRRLVSALAMQCGHPDANDSACNCCQRRWLRAGNVDVTKPRAP